MRPAGRPRQPGGGRRTMNTTEPADERARAEAVLAESGELMRLTAERSLTVRLTGSLAIRVLCPDHAPLLAALGRRPYRDIDLSPTPSRRARSPRCSRSGGRPYRYDHDLGGGTWPS